MKRSNSYALQDPDLYRRTPKAVWAAIAVSFATQGGDHLEQASERLVNEWRVLWENGLVSQRPPGRTI